MDDTTVYMGDRTMYAGVNGQYKWIATLHADLQTNSYTTKKVYINQNFKNLQFSSIFTNVCSSHSTKSFSQIVANKTVAVLWALAINGKQVVGGALQFYCSRFHSRCVGVMPVDQKYGYKHLYNPLHWHAPKTWVFHAKNYKYVFISDSPNVLPHVPGSAVPSMNQRLTSSYPRVASCYYIDKVLTLRHHPCLILQDRKSLVLANVY